MDLRDLYITGAAEVDVGSSSRKAIIIHVSRPPASPCMLLQRFRSGALTRLS